MLRTIVAFRGLATSWDLEDPNAPSTEMHANMLANFPEELIEYVTRSFAELKAEQRRLTDMRNA